MKRLTLGLGALLVVVPLLFVSACATSDSSTVGSVSPSPAASAPSRAEILAAAKRPAPTQGFTYRIKLSPKPEDVGTYAFAMVESVEQVASGRWLATVELAPPGYASTSPVTIVIAKYPDGWRIASSEEAVQRTLSPSPFASPTVVPQ